jgi:hypothetical protein
MSLLLPKNVAMQRAAAKRDEAAAASIAHTRKYELQSDEFVGPAAVRAQLEQLGAYVAERRQASADGYEYGLLEPVGWKIMVLMLTLPSQTEKGLHMVSEALEMRAVTSAQGVVLGVGAGCYRDPQRFAVDGVIKPWIEPGDRITWVKYDAHLFHLANGQVLGFLTDTQPVAIIDRGWKELIP